jgi:uncharacterized protein YacL
MAETQLKHWDRSFEWLFYILCAIVGLVLLTLLPAIIWILAYVLVAAVYLIPVVLVVLIAYWLWRLCFRRG